jgi:hypothetical protein
MKTKLYITALLISLGIIFPYGQYSGNTVFLDDVSKYEIAQSISNDIKIAPFAEKSLDEIISPQAVYTDDNNNIIAMLLKCEQSTNGISFQIGDNTYSLNETPDENGYIYKYFDEGIKYDEITFTRNSETLKATPRQIKAVTTDDSWTTSDDGHTLYIYNGNKTTVIVPNMYNGKIITCVGSNYGDDGYDSVFCNSTTAVTSVEVADGISDIGHFAFYEQSDLTNIVLPESIRRIGVAGFYGTGLKSIVFPPNLNEIYAYAFYGCTSLNCEIEFPQSLTFLGESAFRESAICGDLTIPGGVKSIPTACFYNCDKLNGKLYLSEGVEETGILSFGGSGKNMYFTELYLPTTLKKIGDYCFQNCIKIKNLKLPEGLEIISDGAFDHMQGIENTNLTIPSTVKTMGGTYYTDENTGYGDHIFYDMGSTAFKQFEVADGNEYFTAVDGVLYTKDMKRLVSYPRGKTDTVYELPEGVTAIDQLCFSRNPYLKKLILPDSFVITTDLPDNILNTDSNSLSGGLYVYTSTAEIEVKDTNPNYATENGILYSKNFKTIWYVPTQFDGCVNINEKTEKIAQGCFYMNETQSLKLTAVHIPSSVCFIEENQLKMLNDRAIKSGLTISIDENPYYKIDENGLIEETAYTVGDVNEDGNIDNTDASLVLKYVTGSEINSKFNKKSADADNDGEITVNDVIKILWKVSQ